MRYTFAGMLSGADVSGGIEGRIVRASNKWYFVTRWAGQSFRYVFDTSADAAPQAGPAVLYGAIGSDGLAAVFQRGRAVGWFRGDQRATRTRRQAA